MPHNDTLWRTKYFPVTQASWEPNVQGNPGVVVTAVSCKKNNKKTHTDNTQNDVTNRKKDSNNAHIV